VSADSPLRRREPRPTAGKIDLAGPRRAEAWLWTGPFGHLVAGSLDWGQGMGGYALLLARRRLRRELARMRKHP